MEAATAGRALRSLRSPKRGPRNSNYQGRAAGAARFDGRLTWRWSLGTRILRVPVGRHVACRAEAPRLTAACRSARLRRGCFAIQLCGGSFQLEGPVHGARKHPSPRSRELKPAGSCEGLRERSRRTLAERPGTGVEQREPKYKPRASGGPKASKSTPPLPTKTTPVASPAAGSPAAGQSPGLLWRRSGTYYLTPVGQSLKSQNPSTQTSRPSRIRERKPGTLRQGQS